MDHQEKRADRYRKQVVRRKEKRKVAANGDKGRGGR